MFCKLCRCDRQLYHTMRQLFWLAVKMAQSGVGMQQKVVRVHSKASLMTACSLRTTNSIQSNSLSGFLRIAKFQCCQLLYCVNMGIDSVATIASSTSDSGMTFFAYYHVESMWF